MFCPICKSEYRIGFTKCSDCDVGLVEHLEYHAGAPAMEGDPDARVVLWAGTRDYTRQAIERALNAAKIQYEEDGVESQLMPAFRDPISRILVRRNDFRAATEATENLEVEEGLGPRSPAAVLDNSSSVLRALGIRRNFMGSALEPAAPVEDSDAHEEAEPEGTALEELKEDESSPTLSDSPVKDFYPEDATSEVWTGADEEMAQNMKVCLQEVGIGCVLEDSQGKMRVRVMPQSETHAREIVREIVEASPPQ